MKDDRTGNDALMDEAVSQLRHLGEMQLEESVKAAKTRDGEGVSPAKQENPPQTPRQQLVDRMVAERQSKNGLVTAKEKAAIEHYVDSKVEGMGPQATVSDLSPSEQDSMVGYIKNVDEDMLQKREGGERVTVGPVQKANQGIPFFTTPDYKPEPQEPPDPHPGYTATDDNKPQPPKKPCTIFDGKETTERKMAEYEAAQKQYEDDLKKWEDDKKFQEDHKKYEKDHDLWLQSCKNLDDQFSDIEKACALGIMKTDYDPETGKYTVAHLNNKGEWVREQFDDPKDAKEYARKLTPSYDDFDGGELNQKIMGTEVNDDVLAAISTGDLVVKPNADGSALEVTKHQTSEVPVDAEGKPLPAVLKDGDGQPTFLVPGEGTKGALTDAYKGYQEAADVDYKSVDGRAFNNLEEKRKLLDSATTDENGNRICSACGQPWPEEKPPVGVARSVAILMQKLRYRAGYVSWEKVDSAVKLAKASLSAVGQRRITHEQVEKLLKYTKSVVGNNPELLERFNASLVKSCANSSAVLHDNLHALVNLVSASLPSKDRLRARGSGNCPLCQQPLPEAADRPMNMEMTKAETVFKGDERTDEDARKEFNGRPYTKAEGAAELLRDGTQQAFNPFIDPNGTWTKFSYRPTDSKEAYPIIRIVPASFQGMANINTILNSNPYVFIKEYFMRNNVSSAVNLFQGALEGKADPPASDEANQPSAIKENTTKLTNIIKNAFIELGDPFEQVIDMPYVLYHRLKAKLFGNQYVFPYNPKDFALATSSNAEEWGGTGILASLTSGLMQATNGLTGMLGFGVATPFPAPTWKLPEGGTKWNMTFDLNLINDEFVRARNNYMCANTIINNNRWIQKTILGFPGALYEVLIPTGLRELMCTGTFTLKSLGVNRHVPHDFFDTPFKIGSQVYPGPKGDLHSSAYEVVPDAYTLNCSFQSCIQENLNNSVFAYYLKITDFAPGTPVDSAFDALEQHAPWATAAVAEETTDDVVALQKTVDQIGETMQELVGDQGQKAAAEDAKKQAEAARVTEAPPEGGGGAGGAGGGGGTPPAGSPIRKRDILRSDEQTEAYERQYDSLRKKLSVIKSDIGKNRENLRSLMLKSETLPLTKIRKTYSKRIARVNEEYNELVKAEKQTEDALIETEMSVLMHAKDAVEERANSDLLVVPRGYFDPYQLDEVTALKIKLMTREELDRFIEEKEAHLNAIDEWGIHNCKDFWIRSGAIQFISDAMGELEDLIRDSYEVNTDEHDKYRYRYEMLKDDLRAALDPSKPFILNRTNIIYISPDGLPPNLLQAMEAETSIPTASDDSVSGNGDSSNELIETNNGEGQVPAVVQIEDGSLVVDRNELIKQHRAEVVKQVFGNEEKLAAESFKLAVERYPAAKFDRDALVMLKKTPALDDETDMTDWFGRQEGEMYANVHERMEEREDESVAIYPIDQTFDIHSVNRAGAIFYITQDLYRYVSMCRTVVLGNAMDQVETKSTAVLNRVTQQFQRLEN